MEILVTGASRGIGYQICRQFCQEKGNRVYAVARTDSKLNALASECATFESDSELIPIAANLQNSSEIDKVIESVCEHTNSLSAVINCAGMLHNKTFDAITREELTQMLDVNLIAPFILIQKCLPLLRRSPWAHVVTIGSMGGYQGSSKFAGLSGYSASKAAIANLTECLAEEFKESSIRFNCLALGAVNTEMLQNAFPEYQVDMTAEKMARLICKFTETGHEYFNGKILPIACTTP